MFVVFLSLRRHIFCFFLFSSALLATICGQCFAETPQSEGLKGQLLANLNRYSGQGERAAEGPMESLGARTETISSSKMPTEFAKETNAGDPLSS
ncbi:hypothetical protein niasHT_007585 [Heterodera trifolii]|uniref:Secreted protein n=1 Tax=Heterodera trifolii TaxID=157864 RepID=A0ABD2LPL4_9BILA